ncbi:MAG: hypothetical protein PHS65_06220 [Arcobacteraceae bacterium]|nr:hypothetical protein [Arcobacteraceae bacterium]MDX9796044.1 hypothetical protein [Arcobacteraceae bacterium]
MKKSNAFTPILVFIIVLVGVLFAFVPAVKTSVFQLQNELQTLLVSHYAINGWLLLFLVVFALIGLGGVLYKIYYIKPKKSIYAHHTVQEIKNAVWKWRWNENKIEQLWCFCPTCNDELSYDTDHLLQTITFSCERCNKEVSKFNSQNINAVLAFVKNEIRRILRKNKK